MKPEISTAVMIERIRELATDSADSQDCVLLTQVANRIELLLEAESGMSREMACIRHALDIPPDQSVQSGVVNECVRLNAKIQDLNAEMSELRGQEPLGWIYEDELPENYPYDAMFPFSKVDVVRMFPVYGPVPPATIGWRRVSDGMPADDTTVIVKNEEGIQWMADVQSGEFYPDEFPQMPLAVQEITHWMPFPDSEAPPAASQPDAMLCDFYEVKNYPNLVRELVLHVEQLQESAKRNVKPWQDTFPATLLPAYIERIKNADDAVRAARQPYTVPDEMAFNDEMTVTAQMFAKGHNACRAAMLAVAPKLDRKDGDA